MLFNGINKKISSILSIFALGFKNKTMETIWRFDTLNSIQDGESIIKSFFKQSSCGWVFGLFNPPALLVLIVG